MKKLILSSLLAVIGGCVLIFILQDENGGDGLRWRYIVFMLGPIGVSLWWLMKFESQCALSSIVIMMGMGIGAILKTLIAVLAKESIPNMPLPVAIGFLIAMLAIVGGCAYLALTARSVLGKKQRIFSEKKFIVPLIGCVLMIAIVLIIPM